MSCDRLFQVISIVVLAGSLAAMALHFLAMGRRARQSAPQGGPADLVRYGLFQRLVFAAGILTFLGLAVTGFIPAIFQGARLVGYLLLLHVACGGAFTVCLVLLAVLWADDCRLEPHDRQWCSACCRAGEPPPASRFDAGQKLAFWLAIALGAACTLTMMLSMIPWLGPDGLDVLHEIHRYCALALAAVALIHCYRTMTARTGSWLWLVRGKVNSDWARHYHSIWWKTAGVEESR